ncbi:putative nuclease HARBI1 [Episyrphus balteatus]|uniref:putative nuclease HARBI1 n=1 Tax=Episyrphus balteatus TaxID=286459 RepID=UPI00248646EC|nr:putative nuclease HARBI1 [Episyrphus balteatus]
MLRGYLTLFLSDSEESDDGFVSQNLRNIRRNLRDHSDPFSLPDQNFIQRFRLNKIAFKYVLDNLHVKTGKRATYIPPILRLCSTLEILGGGCYQWLVGNDFACPLAQSTLSKAFDECLNALEDQFCAEWIKWPSEFEEDETKLYFFDKYKIPGVIGCVDGTHIGLLRPTANEEMFFNRKGFHSINAMINNDHKYRIMTVCAQYGGASHDSFVWNSSLAKSRLELKFNQSTRNNSKLLGKKFNR